MSPPARSSHLPAVVFSGLALVLLYFLSAPVVWYTVGGRLNPDKPDWRLDLAWGYAVPYFWLHDHTLLKPLLGRYALWWAVRIA